MRSGRKKPRWRRRGFSAISCCAASANLPVLPALMLARLLLLLLARLVPALLLLPGLLLLLRWLVTALLLLTRFLAAALLLLFLLAGALILVLAHSRSFQMVGCSFRNSPIPPSVNNVPSRASFPLVAATRPGGNGRGALEFLIHRLNSGSTAMGRYLLLWLLGIPLPILVLIWLFGGLH